MPYNVTAKPSSTQQRTTMPKLPVSAEPAVLEACLGLLEVTEVELGEYPTVIGQIQQKPR